MLRTSGPRRVGGVGGGGGVGHHSSGSGRPSRLVVAVDVVVPLVVIVVVVGYGWRLGSPTPIALIWATRRHERAPKERCGRRCGKHAEHG